MIIHPVAVRDRRALELPFPTSHPWTHTAWPPKADRMAGMAWLLGLVVMLRLGKADLCLSDCPDGEAFPIMTFTALAATLNVDVSEITSVSGTEKTDGKNVFHFCTKHVLVGGFKYFLFSPPKIGEIRSTLTCAYVSKGGWFNHQLVFFSSPKSSVRFVFFQMRASMP